MSNSKLNALTAKVHRMTPRDQLILAVGLLDKGEYELAHSIVELALDTLTLMKLVKAEGA